MYTVSVWVEEKWLTALFVVSISFHGSSVLLRFYHKQCTGLSNIQYCFVFCGFFALLQWNSWKIYVYFRSVVRLFFKYLPSTATRKLRVKVAVHQLRSLILFVTRTVDLKEHDFVTSAPVSLKTSQNSLKCHITTKNSAQKPDATFKREQYFEVLLGFDAIR